MSLPDLFSRHPRVPLAVKSAVAASAAWLVLFMLSTARLRRVLG